MTDALDLDIPVLDDELYKDRARTFVEFLDDQSGAVDYRTAVRQMLASEACRLIVSIDDVRVYNRDYADGLLNAHNGYLPPIQHAREVLVDLLHDPLKE